MEAARCAAVQTQSNVDNLARARHQGLLSDLSKPTGQAAAEMEAMRQRQALAFEEQEQQEQRQEQPPKPAPAAVTIPDQLDWDLDDWDDEEMQYSYKSLKAKRDQLEQEVQDLTARCTRRNMAATDGKLLSESQNRLASDQVPPAATELQAQAAAAALRATSEAQEQGG